MLGAYLVHNGAMKYHVDRSDDPDCKGYIYLGYINDVYAGGIMCVERGKDGVDIQYSSLEKAFKGVLTVRAVREIIKVIQKDFKYIFSRIDNMNNISLRIALNEGFHVIGTVSHDNKTAVEILKVREE